MLRSACLALLAAMAFGLWLHLPYLSLEHRRLEWWKIVGLWFGDVSAVWWFLRFAFAHAVLGRPLEPEQMGGRRRRRLWAVGVALLVAMLIDLGFTLYLMHDERAGYERGAVAAAEVTSVRRHDRSAADSYDLDVRFTDAANVTHDAHVRVYADRHVLPPALPPDAARVLRTLQRRTPIRIRYDPQFPTRTWIDGLGWDDENGLYWLSLLTLFFQAMVLGIFLLSLVKHTTQGVAPWWRDTYKAVPLAVEAFWLVTMGMIDLLLDWPRS